MLLARRTSEDEHHPFVRIEALPLQDHTIVRRGRPNINQAPARCCCCPCVVVCTGHRNASFALCGTRQFDQLREVQLMFGGVHKCAEGRNGWR